MNIKAYGSSTAESARSMSSSVADTTRSSTAFANTQQLPTEDTISFASGASSVQALTDAAFDMSSRASKVASLQQAVRSGQYAVDPASIAAALVKADI